LTVFLELENGHVRFFYTDEKFIPCTFKPIKAKHFVLDGISYCTNQNAGPKVILNNKPYYRVVYEHDCNYIEGEQFNGKNKKRKTKRKEE